MGRIISVYGIIAGAIVAGGLWLHMGWMPPETGNTLGMVVGYLTMLVALSMVFVGVRQYRNVEQGGVIRFWKAFGIGLAIAGVATLFYIAAWEVFLWRSGFGFMDDYMAKYVAETVAGMREAGKSAAEIAATEAEWRGFSEQYRQPLFRMAITATEIAPVGLLVALISAAILRNPRAFPARA